jgi:hypothetical protein
MSIYSLRTESNLLFSNLSDDPRLLTVLSIYANLILSNYLPKSLNRKAISLFRSEINIVSPLDKNDMIEKCKLLKVIFHIFKEYESSKCGT